MVLVLIFCKASTQALFIIAFPVILRLSILGLPTTQMMMLLQSYTPWLTEIEKNISVPIPLSLSFHPVNEDNLSILPHPSYQLFATPPQVSLGLWGDCVEMLWRVSMICPQKTAEWDGLSSRLLLWHAIASAEWNQVGEWERREMLINLIKV